MAMYVVHAGPVIIGLPKRKLSMDPGLEVTRAVKVESLDDFLRNLKDSERRYIVNAIQTYSEIFWVEESFPDGRWVSRARKEGIERCIVPIIQSGEIPASIDFAEFDQHTGINSRETLEKALFHLIQNLGLKGIEWGTSLR